MYNEQEMLEICEKYGIETIIKEGLPLYKGEEMKEDFSFENMMNEPIIESNNIELMIH